MRPVFVALTLLAVTAFAAAAETWIITDAEFKLRPAAIEAISQAGIDIAMPDGAKRKLPWEQFLEAQRPAAIENASARFTLHMATGDQLFGDPMAIKGEQLLWKSGSLGEVTVSLRDLRAIVRQGKMVDGIEAERAEDVLGLANGDATRGIIMGFEGGKVTIQSNGAEVPVPMDSVNYVLFAAPAQKRGVPERAFRVRLTDGSQFTVPAIRTEGTNLVLSLGKDQVRTLPMASVVQIEQLNGPVSWLSSRLPEKSSHTPLLGDSALTFPLRLDRNYRGNPIRVGRTVYSRGLGVHSRSVLVYALDGGYEAFRTAYAIDQEENNNKADVTVRIRLDDQLVFEKEHVQSSPTLPEPVLVPLGTAKTLMLEVDYGAGGDTQDRFNWIEPALLKKMPAAPATKPAESDSPTTKPAATATAPSDPSPPAAPATQPASAP